MYDKEILSEKVANTIKKMIIDKKLKPGDKLANEIDLTNELNVSRSTVREAIKILVSTNILEVRRGKGTFVSENPGLYKDPLGVCFMDKKNLLKDLYESRLIIEPGICALAAIRATKGNILQLENSYINIKKEILNNIDHTETDIQFHNIIANSSQNPIINRILPIINEGIQEGYKETKDIRESGDTVLYHHGKILEAIKSRNPELARDCMTDHLSYGMEQIVVKLNALK
ncbi:GntR family transcriptional regulator [Vallitalea longa]|uniref:GntR family transcriptional regulator n=1 Tax=Vallitalea longa TaxID=2936439 RepID=A0A9W6DGU3_9FIRM|nr:FadR/GntR family transcriptional regulator [Vallitalea longa]GKX30798.1 GntR family transcriptional regulator [Vallitalea longa]